MKEIFKNILICNVGIVLFTLIILLFIGFVSLIFKDVIFYKSSILFIIIFSLPTSVISILVCLQMYYEELEKMKDKMIMELNK